MARLGAPLFIVLALARDLRTEASATTEAATPKIHSLPAAALPRGPSQKTVEGPARVQAVQSPDDATSVGTPKVAIEDSIRTGAEALKSSEADFRVAMRSGQSLEALRLPKLPWSAKLPRSLLGQGRQQQADGNGVDEEDDPPVRADGKVRLRVFDGASESHTLALELPCTILGSSLKFAHVADGTHASVKTEHAAVIFVPPESYLLQPLNGEVSLTCASQHAAVSSKLLQERRSGPQCRAGAKLLSVGSAPEEFTRQHCCFQLGKSEVIFFVDLLPSAASVRALGTSRHLLQAFVHGTASDTKQKRAKEQKSADTARASGPRAAKLVPASVANERATEAKPWPVDAPPPPLPPLKFARAEGARRSPSMWRHDRVQRSISMGLGLCRALQSSCSSHSPTLSSAETARAKLGELAKKAEEGEIKRDAEIAADPFLAIGWTKQAKCHNPANDWKKAEEEKKPATGQTAPVSCLHGGNVVLSGSTEGQEAASAKEVWTHGSKLERSAFLQDSFLT
ncbi:unnamed protein product [Symbiodinium sp. CCMP2592]|nr:unnamed protein product [Symbiodinium sp. CCMP2592]